MYSCKIENNIEKVKDRDISSKIKFRNKIYKIVDVIEVV